MSNPQKQFEEKRAPGDAGRRFVVNWDLVAGNKQHGTVRGSVLNVSTAGLLIRVPAPYGIADLVEVEMSPAAGIPVRVVLQIVRLHAMGAEAYDYGATIVRHTDDTRTQFNEQLLLLRRQEMGVEFGRVELKSGVRPHR